MGLRPTRINPFHAMGRRNDRRRRADASQASTAIRHLFPDLISLKAKARNPGINLVQFWSLRFPRRDIDHDRPVRPQHSGARHRRLDR
jgi:hypothetical protein